MLWGLAPEKSRAGLAVPPRGWGWGLPGQTHLRRHVGSLLDYHGVLEVFVQVVDVFTHPGRKESGWGKNAFS